MARQGPGTRKHADYALSVHMTFLRMKWIFVTSSPGLHTQPPSMPHHLKLIGPASVPGTSALLTAAHGHYSARNHQLCASPKVFGLWLYGRKGVYPAQASVKKDDRGVRQIGLVPAAMRLQPLARTSCMHIMVDQRHTVINLTPKGYLTWTFTPNIPKCLS